MRFLKRAIRRQIEKLGYAVRPKSEFGVSFRDDLLRVVGSGDRPCIIDAGANEGQTLAWLKELFPSARICAYEPDPRAFGQLQAKAKSFGSVECVACALGETAGTLELFRNADSVTSSLLPPAASDPSLPYAEKLKPLDRITVEVRTLSGELARLGFDELDLLKTDCQGFDLPVLRGVAREIESGKIRAIATEALFHTEYENQSWFYETMPWLFERGYALIGIYDVMHAADGRMLFGDALFARLS